MIIGLIPTDECISRALEKNVIGRAKIISLKNTDYFQVSDKPMIAKLK